MAKKKLSSTAALRRAAKSLETAADLAIDKPVSSKLHLNISYAWMHVSDRLAQVTADGAEEQKQSTGFVGH